MSRRPGDGSAGAMIRKADPGFPQSFCRVGGRLPTSRHRCVVPIRKTTFASERWSNHLQLPVLGRFLPGQIQCFPGRNVCMAPTDPGVHGGFAYTIDNIVCESPVLSAHRCSRCNLADDCHIPLIGSHSYNKMHFAHCS